MRYEYVICFCFLFECLFFIYLFFCVPKRDQLTKNLNRTQEPLINFTNLIKKNHIRDLDDDRKQKIIFKNDYF